MGEKAKGNLLLIGGAEDKRRDQEILKRFVQLVVKRESYTVILTSATEKPAEAGCEYEVIFKKLGLDEIRALHIADRETAGKRENAELIRQAGGIFFTGGDQLRITSLLGGTLVNDALKSVYQEGAIIAGTSAGASAVSDIMIVGGENDNPPRLTSVELAPGLGLLEETVIDQHFAERGRLGRLLMSVAYNPYILGIGIDENTAIEINQQAEFVVRGSGTVTVIDGRDISYSNVFEIGERQPLALINCRIHTLPAGFGFDLYKREVTCTPE